VLVLLAASMISAKDPVDSVRAGVKQEIEVQKGNAEIFKAVTAGNLTQQARLKIVNDAAKSIEDELKRIEASAKVIMSQTPFKEAQAAGDTAKIRELLGEHYKKKQALDQQLSNINNARLVIGGFGAQGGAGGTGTPGAATPAAGTPGGRPDPAAVGASAAQGKSAVDTGPMREAPGDTPSTPGTVVTTANNVTPMGPPSEPMGPPEEVGPPSPRPAAYKNLGEAVFGPLPQSAPVTGQYKNVWDAIRGKTADAGPTGVPTSATSGMSQPELMAFIQSMMPFIQAQRQPQGGGGADVQRMLAQLRAQQMVG